MQCQLIDNLIDSGNLTDQITDVVAVGFLFALQNPLKTNSVSRAMHDEGMKSPLLLRK